MSYDEAFRIISSESGKHFDPKITEVFLGMRDEIVAVSENLSAWKDRKIYIPDYIGHDNVRSKPGAVELTEMNISGDSRITDTKEERKENLIKQELNVSDKNSGND